MEWISVKKELPRLEKYVLCCVSNRIDEYSIFVGKLDERHSGEKYWSGPRDYDIWEFFEDVTHWMPLPDHPEHFPDAKKMVDHIVGGDKMEKA